MKQTNNTKLTAPDAHSANCLYFVFCIFYIFVVLMGISPMGNSGRFPQGNPAATESRYPTLIHYEVHAGSFRASILHRTLTWTTGSLTCVRDHSYTCVYTRGLGTPTTCQHNVFDLEETIINVLLVLLTEFEPRVFGSRVRRSTN